MIMNKNFNIGYRVYELRTERGLSQEQLALQAEITPTYLGQIERNIKNPTVHIIEKLCFAMNISLSGFFSTTTTPTELDTLSTQILTQVVHRTEDEKKAALNILRQLFQLCDSKK